jgi:hypothetical protein
VEGIVKQRRCCKLHRISFAFYSLSVKCAKGK